MRALTAGLVLAGLSGAALADDPLAGKVVVVPPAGAPFCSQHDDLQEFVQAGMSGDRDWIRRLRGCYMIKAGLKVAVIEDEPSTVDAMHMIKVRVLGRAAAPVGYSLSLGLQSASPN